MSECYLHEKYRRQGSQCPYCRIAELEAENERLKHENAAAWDSAEHNARRAERAEAALREIRDMDIGAIPESTDYASGHNDCRQQMWSLKRAILAKYKEEGK